MAEPEGQGVEASAGSPRRAPAQQRSRERLERILSVASGLIAERGSDLLRMSEVAELAGISIGSLYQYFPDKAAVIRALTERISAGSRRCIEEALTPVRSSAELGQAYGALIDVYWALFVAEPAMRDIWAGVQADRELMALELAESRACGDILAAAMLRARPNADERAVRTTAFLVWQLGEATMRLATGLPRGEADAVVAAYKQMSQDAILTAG